MEALGTIAITQITERSIAKALFAPQFKYHLSRDLIDDIKDTPSPEGVALKIEMLFRRDGHIWDQSSEFSRSLPIEAFVGNFASPSHKSIRTFLRRFGFDQFENELRSILQRDYQACVNMVDQVVLQRNKIAHGDSLAYGSPSDLRNMYQLVKLYCRNTDEVVGNWFRSKGCPIR